MKWLEPPKGFSLNRHIAKVERVERFMESYMGKTFSPALGEDMLATLCARLNYRVTGNVVIRAADVLPEPGTVFDIKARRCLALMLVEHDAAFRHGELPDLWDGSPPLWMCVRFAEMHKLYPTKPGIPLRYTAKLLVITGPAAGYVMCVNLSLRYAQYLPKMLGCPKRERVVPADALGMHTIGRLGTKKGTGLSLMELETTSSMRTANRDIYRRRH